MAAADGRGAGVSCTDVSDLLAGVAAGEQELSRSQRHHVEHCLRCQAEVVQHRRILRTMRQLREEVIEPAPGMLPEMLARVHDVGERSAVRSLVARRHVQYSVAIAGLGTAAVAGTLLTLRRRRSSRPAAQGAAGLDTAAGDTASGAG